MTRLDDKESICNAGGAGLIPGLGRSPGGENYIHLHFAWSTLAWKIPWTEEPGRLQFMRSPRIRHDSVSNIHMHTHTH